MPWLQILALQGAVPRERVRDTALYGPLMSRHPVSGKLRSRRLRHVVQQELGLSIQEGEHDPAQDARAALYVYHKHRCAAPAAQRGIACAIGKMLPMISDVSFVMCAL